ncbi:MAG: hypothetical protein NUV84_02225 [Candidatus Uhrbacteria bacterium]|nr:hypothetical protein [Candidatus Uhrbacteria bacterium]
MTSPKGPYALAYSDELKAKVSFSVTGDVWRETSVPQQGMVVVLSGVHGFGKGWRATSARLYTPADNGLVLQT